MLVRFGRYGKFLACPGYPECKGTARIHEKVPGKCPKCSKSLVRRMTKKRLYFYGCSKYPNCDFISWDEPTENNCPKCKKTLFRKKGKKKILYCTDENCGYRIENDEKEK